MCSQNPTEKPTERRAEIEAVANSATHKHKHHTSKEDAVKTKLKATLAAAVIITLALIAGWIDNDYHDQRAQERTECAWITTPDGMSICR